MVGINAKIAALFNLPVKVPPVCDENSCKFILDFLYDFYTHAVESNPKNPWNKSELDALSRALKVIQATKPCEKIEWMPDYGCALLKSEVGCTSGVIALNLIALDLHRFQTTSKLGSGGYNYIDGAAAMDYEVLYIGTCGVDELKDVQGKFQGLLALAQSRTGNNRTARGGKQGHQRTPAFIHALYRQVFGQPNQTPRGGMTDVGLHTGGQQRDTAPPLVFYSLCQILHDQESEFGSPISADVLFKKTLVYLGLYASESTLKQYDKEGITGPCTNAPDILLENAFSILRSASIKAAALSDDGLDLTFFVEWSESIRDKIMEKASLKSGLYSQQYKLPQGEAGVRGHFKNYSINVPSRYSPAKDSALSESEVRKNTHKNLGWVPVLNGKSLNDVDEWVKKAMPTTKQDPLSLMLVLRSVEMFMWSYAEKLPIMEQHELETLASIVDNYREVLHNFKIGGHYEPISLVELKSREVLVVWVAFCIVHSNAVRLHKAEMGGYGVPLDFNDLAHLVLSDAHEWEVALHIAEYLGKHGTNQPIFSLKDETPTFDMGRRIANASPEMLKVWKNEEEDALGRVEGHWKEVLRKQELARKLRAEIVKLQLEVANTNAELAPKRNELATHESRLRTRNARRASVRVILLYNEDAHETCRRSVNSLTYTVNSLNSQLSSKQSSLNLALQAPPPVLQPLPQRTNNAMPIIFFLYMPPIFRLLSRLSFTSQQLRLPQLWSSAWSGQEGSERIDITNKVTRGANIWCQYSWKDYYNRQQTSQYHHPSSVRRGSDFHLLLRSVRNAVPQQVGPRSVDHMSRSDGIWYPDELKPRMAWLGGTKIFDASSGCEINPFVDLDHLCIVSNFTERLPSKHCDLQWTLIQPGDQHISHTRGNLPYARQNAKPHWLSKTQYLSFSNMRSYPNIQLRNIMVAIQERQLPLTETVVHTLVKQTLFHIGEITEIHDHPKLEWKGDLEDSHFCKEASAVLKSFYGEIKDSPRSYMCVKLIGKLCNFFSHWEPDCRITAQKLATSAYQWADHLSNEVEQSPPLLAPKIRAKQVVLYQHAILALAGGSLTKIDVALLIKMVVKCRNYFTGDNRLKEIRANETEISYELSQKTEYIIEAALLAPSMMTDALQSVYQRCPTGLNWKRWNPDDGSSTQCVQAKGKDGHFYSINLITGEVLIDGLPPSRLPGSILNHPLYKRTFGDRNFEIVGKGNFLETCRLVFGRFYKFSKASPLKIYEFKEDGSEMLELLDGYADRPVWARDLPLRLLKLCSHWLFREKNLIVLRDICFKERNIHNLIQLKFDVGENVEGQVKCVESHSNTHALLDLTQELATMDTLILHQSPALDIISKFESKQYIHSLISPPDTYGQDTLRFFLPRYKLTFDLLQGDLICREVSGYQLMAGQQTDGTFRGINMYLLLEQTVGKGRLVIFPKGGVARNPGGQVHIEVKDDCSVQLMWSQYEFHPRFDYIETKQSRASRMQLAALHIATSSVLPDKLLDMTGEERAITLIRQSWANRPLNKEECLILDNIKQLAHGLSPTISILCKDIEISSQQLIFLYSNVVEHIHFNTECYEQVAYLNNVKNHQVSCRCYLTPREESKLIGLRARRPTLPPRFIQSQTLLQSPITDHELKSLQNRLDEYQSRSIHQSKRLELHDKTFPLDIKPSSKLELDMIDELKESWDAHISSVSHHTSSARLNTKSLQEIHDDSLRFRQKAEDFLLRSLNEVPEKRSHWHGNAHEVLRIAGLVPTATTADLAKIAIEPSMIKDFNPMITHESCLRLLESISIFLQLCVYEDKLARLVDLSKSSSNSNEDLMRELDTVTVWNTSKHPYWLVFEVENGIQIRQAQYKVAQHLIDNPGDVIQLNMGLGKTRVILPMLVLYFSFHKHNLGREYARERVTRLHFLSALFEEAFRYLQNHLCASILGIKIYTMPFCRDFKLDVSSITTMKDAIDDCRIEGGAFVVAPEHRLSLELKSKELHHSGETDIAACIEKELITQDIWRDVLDEVDEILRHRFQLIYAIGTAKALPSGCHRWRAVQALFAALAQNDNLRKYLSSHQKACKVSAISTAEWPEIQLFDGGALDDMLGDYSERRSSQLEDGLLSKLADVILSNPPHELKWVLDHRLTADIKKVMIEKEYTHALKDLPRNQLSDILALRGFLAGGVLRHCLLKRHRVNFGVARPGKKHLAVPFRSSDTPDERAEFAHPDCAIAFTILAYYHDGLTKNELMQALKNLMSLGENAQRNFYNSWFVASSGQMKAAASDCFESLDSVDKIDLTNDSQMENMYHWYNRNMSTINFYLNTCVLPTETDQFDSRLTATSWNLAQNASNNIVGFSGTNDNHRILPLQVRQYFASKESEPDPVLKDLDGTNGKMLEMIIKCTLAVQQLGNEANLSESIINILREGFKGSTTLMHAIIDCGALLAGTDLQEISRIILKQLPVEGFGGVLFYDGTKLHDWVILERSGRILPKDVSPITEKDTFVIFDEPRCRGTDLKLRPDAVALLTLAPNLCKDKLMQAAGRLRKLGRNQKLVMAGGPDVFTKLQDLKKGNDSSNAMSAAILSWVGMNGFEATAKQVLSWAMKNTFESTAAGFPNWANQGLFFASTFGKDPLLNITGEVLELDDMYGKAFTKQTVAKTTDNAHGYHMKRTGGVKALHDSVKDIVVSVHKRVHEYGDDFKVSASGCDEECERELELEIEEEEEVEVEVPMVNPVVEKKWDFNKALTCKCPSELPIGVQLIPAFIQRFIKPAALAEIQWPNDIYCTDNFAKTIVSRSTSSTSALNRFLRVVNFVLCFPGGDFLLLSEFEANNLLKLFWNYNHVSSSRSYHLVHLCLLRQSLDSSSAIFLQRTLPKRGVVLNNLFGGRSEASDIISEDSMASLQLFAGESTYSTDGRKEALKSLLRVKKTQGGSKFCPRTEAERLVGMRGLEKLFPYSDLEAMCEKLLCEL